MGELKACWAKTLQFFFVVGGVGQHPKARCCGRAWQPLIWSLAFM
jgi:hypothetical protein